MTPPRRTGQPAEGAGADAVLPGPAEASGLRRPPPLQLTGRLAEGAAVLFAAASLCAGPAEEGPALVRPEAVDTLSHDSASFTQGLEFHGGLMLESSGGYGRSWIALLDPAAGATLARTPLGPDTFAEGLTVHDGTVYLLTWREGMVLLLDADALRPLDTLRIEAEGWGICSDGSSLITSSGSHRLVRRCPEDMRPIDTISVSLGGMPQPGLNELEWTEAGILANQFGTDRLLLIAPEDGAVRAVIDLSALSERGMPGRDVMNGVAQLGDGRLVVTGKLWHRLYLLPPPREMLR